MPDRIESELVRIIAKHCSPEFHEALSLGTTLEATGIDSLGMAEAFFELEDMFALSIPEPDASSAAHFHTLQDVYDAIASAKPASA